MRLYSPAKLNLSLRILRRREDGYHDLFMLMEKLNFCDEIVLENIPSGIEVTALGLDIPLGKNLVWKAAAALRKLSDFSHGVRIHLTKNIPMGSGLGGGSANAGTVLKGLNKLWELNCPTARLAEVGAKLGADIPFFLYDGPAIVEGIGDRVTPLKSLPKLWIILINPGIHIGTPGAYAEWDKRKTAAPFPTRQNELTQENQSVRGLSTFETFADVVEVLHNDFEAVVLPKVPEIGRAKLALLKAGAAGALMTGSGSTVFGIFETKNLRDRALECLKVKPGWRVFSVENLC